MTHEARALVKYWLEAGTVLYFEPQPNKSHIPRRGEYFLSIAVYKAAEIDPRLAELEQVKRDMVRLDKENRGQLDTLQLVAYIIEHDGEFDRPDFMAMEATQYGLERLLQLKQLVAALQAQLEKVDKELSTYLSGDYAGQPIDAIRQLAQIMMTARGNSDEAVRQLATLQAREQALRADYQWALDILTNSRETVFIVNHPFERVMVIREDFDKAQRLKAALEAEK